jgi:hypothetical protein
MPQWNNAWPKPMTKGYRLSTHDQTLRTDMEVGFARVRRLSTARNDKVSVNWVMSNAQFTEFRLWFDDDFDGAGGGVIWFDVPLARAMVEPMPSLGDSPTLAWVQARFVGSYSASLEGAYLWMVSAELELRSRS